MQKNTAFSIVTIACFISVLFIPIGLVLMWFYTGWKKRTKIIVTSALTLVYAAVLYLALNLERVSGAGGVTLPVSVENSYDQVNAGGSEHTDQISEVKGSSKKADNPKTKKVSADRLPKTVTKGKGPGRLFYSIMFFLFMLFLVIWQNLKNQKKTEYENPYVDVKQYKLPLNVDSKMPMVHFLRLKMKSGEKILYATETTQKENKGDFIVTNERVVVFSKGGDYEFPLEALTAISSVSGTVIQLTSGERKYFIFMPENQLKYALAVVRWAYAKKTGN